MPGSPSNPVSLPRFCFSFAGAGASVFRGWSEPLARAVTALSSDPVLPEACVASQPLVSGGLASLVDHDV